MIIIIATLLGAAIGALTARRRKGRLADVLQYAAVYAIGFALLGLFATILFERALR